MVGRMRFAFSTNKAVIRTQTVIIVNSQLFHNSSNYANKVNVTTYNAFLAKYTHNYGAYE